MRVRPVEVGSARCAGALALVPVRRLLDGGQLLLGECRSGRAGTVRGTDEIAPAALEAGHHMASEELPEAAVRTLDQLLDPGAGLRELSDAGGPRNVLGESE